MKQLYTTIVLFSILTILAAIAFSQGRQNRFRQRYHSGTGQVDGGVLPTGYNDLFAGSGECLLCHNEQVNQQGESVSIIADWRSSMMANAAKDPFWQAKVSHEGLVNPAHKEVLEDVCTRCHAPAGQHNAHHNGQVLYSMDEMREDPLALDGVQCTVCHQITEESLGNFSGQVEIGADKTIWGPYEAPFTNPMIINTGYTPEHGPHIREAKLCGGCHTLITNTADLNGNLTGEAFVEQSIYHEWLNSDHAVNGQVCQDCHVPRIDEEVVISALPPWLDPRTPFGMHHMAGANVFMTQLIKDFGSQVGVTATEEQLDSTINRSTRMLQQRTLNISLNEEGRSTDTLFVSMLLQNKAGHKFPSGYPARRAFVELIAVGETGETLLHTGRTDAAFNLIAENEDYENHYTMINNDDQVQIYEMVMGNVEGNVTTVLERAATALKDNRIPPAGFVSSHNSYDTVKIVGVAQSDPNFNRDTGTEGSGSDRIFFHIPTNGSEAEIHITAKVYYQSVNDKWLTHMFSYGSEQIDAFKSLYENSDKTPVLVGETDLISLSVNLHDLNADKMKVFPNPAHEEVYIHFDTDGTKHISVFTAEGKLLESHTVVAGRKSIQLNTSGWRGILFLKTDFADNTATITKLLVH